MASARGGGQRCSLGRSPSPPPPLPRAARVTGDEPTHWGCSLSEQQGALTGGVTLKLARPPNGLSAPFKAGHLTKKCFLKELVR